MWKTVVAGGFLLLGGCAGGPGQIASPACAPHRSAGPCFDATDITDRRNRDDVRDITVRVPDDTRDVTDRRNRDDTTDRTIWCPG
jgi:hypothetical protein